MKKNKTKVF